MQVHIRAFCERAADSNPGTPIAFVASTSDLARDGMTIDAKGWKLDNYRSSPVVLWSHDYIGNRPPIGRAENVRVDGDKLRAEIVFDQGDPFAVDIERKYREGFLNAVSVGWETLEFQPTDANQPWNGGKVLSAELLDISAVNVPGDPNALMERQKRALVDVGRQLLQLADTANDSSDPQVDPLYQAATTQSTNSPTGEPPSARTTWPDAAAQMVRLYRPFVQGPDDERSREYQRLTRAYARHGKTPPEFLTAVEVDALSIDDIRAMFLEGEPELLADVFSAMETRAGAVLSTRNQEDLQRAADLILGVLARAKKEAEQTEEERAAEEALRHLHTLFRGDQAA